MPGSLSKYFSQSNDSFGNKLWWPGTLDGYPFRSTAPPQPMKQEEFEKIPLVYDAKVAVLELPRDNDKYVEILDKCANGWYQLRHERIDYDSTKDVYRIFLQWLEIYGETPTTKSAFEKFK